MEKKTTLTKPLTLVREDFLMELVSLCNNYSELPFFIIENILKDFLQEVHLASQQQLEADRNNYKRELLKLQSQPEIKSEEDKK